MNVAQSAFSQQIGLLEYELEERLFKRVNKKIFITPAGEAFLRYARRIFQDLRKAMEVSEISRLEWGHLRIGAGMMACIYTLPPPLSKSFRALHPRIEIEVATGTTDAMLSKLRSNAIEIGVLTVPRQGADLEVIPLCEEEMVVVVSGKHPTLSRKSSMKAEEIAKHPLILFPRNAHTRRVIDAFFTRAGIVPRILMESENVASIKPLVKIDLGIGIMPLRAVAEETKQKELHYLRIRGHWMARQLGLVYLKSDHTSKALQELSRLFFCQARDTRPRAPAQGKISESTGIGRMIVLDSLAAGSVIFVGSQRLRTLEVPSSERPAKVLQGGWRLRSAFVAWDLTDWRTNDSWNNGCCSRGSSHIGSRGKWSCF